MRTFIVSMAIGILLIFGLPWFIRYRENDRRKLDKPEVCCICGLNDMPLYTHPLDREKKLRCGYDWDYFYSHKMKLTREQWKERELKKASR